MASACAAANAWLRRRAPQIVAGASVSAFGCAAATLGGGAVPPLPSQCAASGGLEVPAGEFVGAVIVPRPAEFAEKRAALIGGGLDNLAVIADFDRTITTAFVGEKRGASCYGVADGALSPEIQAAKQKLFDHYYREKNARRSSTVARSRLRSRYKPIDLLPLCSTLCSDREVSGPVGGGEAADHDRMVQQIERRPRRRKLSPLPAAGGGGARAGR